MAKEMISHLRKITQNLWWCWHPEVWQLFNELDPKIWQETNHNPIAFLDMLGEEEIAKRAKEHALASRILYASLRLDEYLASAGPASNMEAGPLHVAPVAYFCAEFGIHESLPIYSGGLGVLAGDHLKAASDLGVPLIGVGLFYAEGYFQQGIDEEGYQQEFYGRTNIAQLPIHKVTDKAGVPLEVSIELAGRSIKAHVWETPVGRNRLIMLDCDIAANPDEDRRLTTQLYGGDHATRIRQEALLGIGGVRALKLLGVSPGVYHLNEGHSAFATLELCAQLMEEEGESFEDARDRVSKMTVFTTHTPVPAGHDRFAPHMLEDALSSLRERLRLSHREFHGLGRINLDNADEPFCMTVLALKMSDYCNGVSHLHGRVSRRMWKDLWPFRKTAHVPIDHITNGVHTSSFLAPQMRLLYDRHLGSDWMPHMDQPEAWAGMAQVDPGELWEVHQILKSELIDFVRERVRLQNAPRGDGHNRIMPGQNLESDILTIGFARRFATYKRADLLMSDMERFEALINDSARPIQIIYAGKAHPADENGKRLIQKIVKLTTDPVFQGRVVFLADYDMNVGRHLVQGVDLWLNNPRRPQEACGTSGQKVVLNGALNCSVLDGWWAEAYDGKNGFAIGTGKEFADPGQQDIHDCERLYDVLEQEVIPMYYHESSSGLRREWIERMTWAITSLGWRFNAQRMMLDYLRNAYLPAVGATTSS
ncbi:MAG: alpha-glucan family phosphorylase [Bradymonadaceae bacterium]|nr:alpha-glucan family phosphorylase [Lujinxingiaceae bacterium]